MKKILSLMCVAIAIASCHNNQPTIVTVGDCSVPQAHISTVTVTKINKERRINGWEYRIVYLSDGEIFEPVENRIRGYNGTNIAQVYNTWRMHCALTQCQVGDTLVKVEESDKSFYYLLESAEYQSQPTFKIVEIFEINQRIFYMLDNGAAVVSDGYVINHDGVERPQRQLEEWKMARNFRHARVGMEVVYERPGVYTLI